MGTPGLNLLQRELAAIGLGLLATTDEWALAKPLRDRMQLRLRFDFYAVAELVDVLRNHATAMQWQVERAALLPIAVRAQRSDDR